MIGEKHIGITEEILDSLGSRWSKKDGETRWYVNGIREKVGTWCKSEFSGVKVWLDRDGAVHVDHCLHSAVEKDILAKMDRMVEEAMPVQEAADVSDIELADEQVEAMSAWAVCELSAEAMAEPEVQETEIRVVHLERRDGQVARVLLPWREGDDVWTAIGREYPEAWEAADDGMLAPEYAHVTAWDERFEPGEDAALAQWLSAGLQPYAVVDVKGEDEAIWTTYCPTEDEAVCEARRQWEALTRSEQSRRHIVAVETLGRPAEETAGEIVWDSDYVGSISGEYFDEILRDADLDEWGEGDFKGQMVQEGVWQDRHIQIVYELPEGFDEACTHESQDEVLRDAVVDIVWREYE